MDENKKYIRTKDNKIYIFCARERYSIRSNFMIDRYKELKTGRMCAYGYHVLKKENIYKESDDIHHVCDRCVIKTKYDHEPLYGTFYELSSYIESWKKNIPSNNPVTGIYGGIWTESGFELICKLTQEGEYVPFIK